ncbi:hypothetical protein Ae201684P_009335 [Aphanomyces euteiches]|uniref:Uncharacterized protein n=1 Tax=Aphanomyces euteiches TaxID=100861 RepID=A0A6G0WN81_9STRA|nr:hypothetical protein Ae201684_013371 [Aphanomyces euteiches]KAH9063070.1 hypothetical protein Ae201684P_009335 [Aphanomyces euteiches]KAH9156465.1 hypothetical protein AeRB84_001629 [Aphanomyces euteiches]
MSHMQPFTILSLHSSSRIRLSNFPKESTQWMEEAVTMAWPHKTESTGAIDQVVEIKLGGSQWKPGGQDKIQAARLMRNILTVFRMHGYALYTSTNVRNGFGSKDVLFFERPEPCRMSMFIVARHNDNKLRLIHAPVGMVVIVTECIQSNYTGGSVRVSEYMPACHEFKLKSDPWEDGRSPHGRLMLAHLFALLNGHGWRLSATILHSREDEAEETWYFSYEPVAQVVGIVHAPKMDMT